jgi:hypothetical protein
MAPSRPADTVRSEEYTNIPRGVSGCTPLPFTRCGAGVAELPCLTTVGPSRLSSSAVRLRRWVD